MFHNVEGMPYEILPSYALDTFLNRFWYFEVTYRREVSGHTVSHYYELRTQEKVGRKRCLVCPIVNLSYFLSPYT